MITDSHQHAHAANRYAVIPTAERLEAEAELTGRGVAIAFLDSGFYPHPDLTHPQNRIAAYVDITQPGALLDPASAPESWAWHGTMTSVAAAGNGWLSDGLYKGLAGSARVVLIKVSDNGRITEPNIASGLEWVLAHRETYGIRVLSISLGGDEDVPYEQNQVDRLAEEAVRAGIVVVVAAGNAGCTAKPNVVPPANSPSVITVGGYDDKNRIHPEHKGLYCSSYGWTADGLQKPEILAPAIWVAAPILPLTPEYRRAQALSELAAAPDYKLPALAEKLSVEAGLFDGIQERGAEIIRATVEQQLITNKIVATHYQHVDGTSFAAPLVASLIAQMLEANPALTPGQVKQILIDTAERLRHEPLLRQGYGIVNAREAIEKCRREIHACELRHFRPPRVEDTRLIFQYHDDSAKSVSVAGDFNQWNPERSMMNVRNGSWTLEIPTPAAGRYRYKFFVDGTRWVEDPSNGAKETDEYGGFNSVLQLK